MLPIEVRDRRISLPTSPVKMTQDRLSTVPVALEVYRRHREAFGLRKGWFIDNTPHTSIYEEALRRHYPHQGEGSITVYNPSARVKNAQYRRVERETVEDSISVLHVKRKGIWYPHPDRTLPVQDPFVATVGDQLIVGGVQTHPIDEHNTLYWTQFYKGSSPETLEEWVRGPNIMKDIRLSERVGSENPDNPIIDIYPRQFELHNAGAERGNIAHLAMPRSEFLAMTKNDSAAFSERLATAPLLPVKFPEGNWGGVNTPVPIDDPRSYFYRMNLLLIHQAYYDQVDIRQYVARALIHDPVRNDIYDRGIIGEASDFPDSTPKKPGLDKIFFPGDIHLGNGSQTKYPFAFLEGGVRDNRHGMTPTFNPLQDVAA